MTYPPAPWIAFGNARYTIRLVEIERVRALVPAPFHIIPFLPGKTFASLYFADYQPGSDVVYSELFLAPAMVRFGRHIGAWVSHIYVDDPASVAGGREIWGLPKQLARFNWDLVNGRVEAWQDNQLLCAFNSQPPSWRLPAPGALSFLSCLGNQVLSAKSSIGYSMGISRGMVVIPDESPLAGFGLDGPAIAYHHAGMVFKAHAPQVVGQVPAQPASK